MTEYSLEFTVRMTAPKPWNANTVMLMQRIFMDKGSDLAEMAQRFAAEWTKHGEPVEASVQFGEVVR